MKQYRGRLFFCFVYRLATGWMIWVWGVRFPAGAGNFSLFHRVQTCSVIHPDPCPMNTVCSCPG